jgi:hypothetical protein
MESEVCRIPRWKDAFGINNDALPIEVLKRKEFLCISRSRELLGGLGEECFGRFSEYKARMKPWWRRGLGPVVGKSLLCWVGTLH